MNPHVREWQRALAGTGIRIVADGDFGPKTLRASVSVLGHNVPDDAEPDKTPVQRPMKPANVAIPTLQDAHRPVDELIWHCAATPEGRDYTVEQIRSWHKRRGWSDIGYHFVVYRDGSAHVGRPISKVGAHTGGYNTGTIGAVYIGGMSSDMKRAKDTRTPAQRESMLALTRAIVDKYNIEKISGHNQYASKACPSFDVRTDALGNIEGFSKGRKL